MPTEDNFVAFWDMVDLLSNYHLYYNLVFILHLLTNFDLQFYRLNPIIENIVCYQSQPLCSTNPRRVRDREYST
jgi:hypothetical protein